MLLLTIFTWSLKVKGQRVVVTIKSYLLLKIECFLSSTEHMQKNL